MWRVAVSLIVLTTALLVAPHVAGWIAESATYETCIATVKLFLAGLLLAGSCAYAGYVIGKWGRA
jgi:hypothetical protein